MAEKLLAGILSKVSDFFDICCLGVASLTSRAWTKHMRERVRQALANRAKLESVCGVGQAHSVRAFNTESPLAALAGKLIGIGGMSRVYQYAGIPELCVKVCTGGSFVRTCGCADPFTHYFSAECREVDAKCKRRDGCILEAMYNWGSATTDLCGRISPEACNQLLKEEYTILQEMSSQSSSRSLLPLPLCAGFDSQRGCMFYMMERIPGLTLKQFLQCSTPVVSGNTAVSLDSALDIMTSFISLLRALRELNTATKGDFWHGDIKPTNMLLCASAADPATVSIRLIDPVARPGSVRDGPLKQFLTVQYNPKAYMKVFADTFGLALCILEVLCDEQPFQGFVRGTGDSDVDLNLKERLAQYRASWAEHPLVMWLLHWIDMDINHFLEPNAYPGSIPGAEQRRDRKRTYGAMMRKLETFKSAGFTLARRAKGATDRFPPQLFTEFADWPCYC